MKILTAALSLFLVYNVIGNIPLFVAILAKYSPKKQRLILLREMIIALFILIIFALFGDNVLRLLGITQGAIGVSGGILLFIIALMMIFPKHEKEKVAEHEPLIVPLAIPTMAGPGTITASMVYSHTMNSDLNIILAIVLAWIPSLFIVLSSSYVKRVVGDKGLVAFERFGGLLISLIAVQMISTGVIKIIKANFL